MGSLYDRAAAPLDFICGAGQVSPRETPVCFEAHQCLRRIRVAARLAEGYRKEQPMLDLILIALGLGFFAVSVAYVFGCDRL
jgi:hypothetical protein